jgi:hypothetical protein
MNNYICINNQKIGLSEDQVRQIRGSFGLPRVKLEDVPVGETFKVRDHEMIVLEQTGSETLLLRKEPLKKNQQFGTNNNYNGSYADAICQNFAKEIAAIVGDHNLLLHDVDLTADDGLKDYGIICRTASLLTAPQARKYVEILDKYNPGAWWWLATPWSTPTHGSESLVKCVSPSGDIGGSYCDGDYGVRPFCILKSNIFVSK